MKKLMTLVLAVVAISLATPATVDAATPKLMDGKKVVTSSVSVKSAKTKKITVKSGKIKGISVKSKKVCTVSYTKYNKKKKNSGTNFTIKAKSNTSGKTKSTTVTVKFTNGKSKKVTVKVSSAKKSSSSNVDKIEKINFAKSEYEVNVHEAKTLKIALKNESYLSLCDKVKWSSENTKIATVDQKGNITFTGKMGYAWIDLDLYSGSKEVLGISCKVTVVPCCISKMVKDKPATCTKAATYVYACEHNRRYTERDVDSNADGIDGYSDDWDYDDWYDLIESEEPLGHAKGNKIRTITASKQGQGYSVYACSRCGVEMVSDYVDYNPTEQQIYNEIMALQSEYPHGAKWDYDSYWVGTTYSENGTIFTNYKVYACAGFSELVRERVFGYLPMRLATDSEPYRVGDIVWVRDTLAGRDHAEVVTAVNGDVLAVMSGNVNGKVSWKGYLNAHDDRFIIYKHWTSYPVAGKTYDLSGNKIAYR